MLIGLLLALLTGFFWTITGIVMSRCAHKSIDYAAFSVVNSFATLILIMALNVHWTVVFSGHIETPLRLFSAAFGGGLLNAVGILLLQNAMAKGHNGSTWAIGQSAMIVPFLFGAIAFAEPVGLFRGLGAVLIAIGILLPSLVSWRSSEAAQHRWLMTTIASFLALGISMSMMNAPSYWAGWHDNGQLRAFLVYGGGLIPFLIASDWRCQGPLRLEKKTYFLASALSVTGVIGAVTLYASLDRLAKNGAGSIGYPLMIGTCIAGFALYSLLLLREKNRWSDWAGLAAIITGIAAMAAHA